MSRKVLHPRFKLQHYIQGTTLCSFCLFLFLIFLLFLISFHAEPSAREMSQKLDLDGLLRRMTDCRGKRVNQVAMTEAEIMELIQKARAIFLKQPMLLELEPPLKVVREQSIFTHTYEIVQGKKANA